MAELDLALLQEFLVESLEHLEEMEGLLLQVEKEPQNTSLFDDIFRTIHSIKGGAQYLELAQTSELTHRMEDLLDLLREGKKLPTFSAIDSLIAGRDRLVALMAELEETHQENSQVADLVERINTVMHEDTAVVMDDPAPDNDGEDEDDIADPAYQQESGDQELFNVFIQNMREKYVSMRRISGELLVSPNRAALYKECAGYLENLRSASNYMGYEKLARFFARWHDDVLSTSPDSADIPDQLLNRRLNLLAEQFPQIKLSQAELERDMEEAGDRTTIVKSSAIQKPASPEDTAVMYHFGDKDLAETAATQISQGIPDMGGPAQETQTIAGGASAADQQAEEEAEDMTGSVMSVFEAEAAAEPEIIPDVIPEVIPEQAAAPMPAEAPVPAESASAGEAEMIDEEDLEGEAEIDLALLPEFLIEGREHLEEIESLLLELESNPGSKDILDGIFRFIHTIKGGSQFIGLRRLSRLAHRMEDLLDQLRSGKKETTTAIVDLLIASRDRLNTLMGELEETESEKSSVKDLVQRLTTLIEGGGEMVFESAEAEESVAVAPQPAQPVAPVPTPASETIVSGDAPTLSGARFEEEYDTELYQIFKEHLADQLAQINKDMAELARSPDAVASVRSLEECVGKLRTSANYMGYEELSAFYSTWIADLGTALAAMGRGERVSMAFMDSYIGKLLKTFPGLELEAPPVAPPPPPAVPAPAAQAPAFAAGDDEELLFEKLSDALESSMRQADGQDYETLQQVLDEVLSPGERLTKKEAAIPSPTPASVESLQAKAAEKAAEKAAPSPAQAEVVGPERRATDRRVGDQRLEDRREGDRRATGPTERVFKKSIRVDAEKIDTLMNQVGELVVDRSYFFQLFNDLRGLQSYLKDNGLPQKDLKQIRAFLFKLGEAIASLSRTSNELQEGVMKVRMLPISQLFNRYPRLVHDLTRKNGKKVNLEVKGGETELDKMVVEELSDPLIHIIRNAVDHGIEMPEERVAAGKDETGTLLLEAYQESNHIVIEVTDDGRGISTERIKEKALEKGLYTEEELNRMSSRELTWLILSAGFSTAKTVSDTSGRGVGMDVVKKNIEKLNGTLEIDSVPGQQTQIRLKIPLTLAIIAALLVRVGGDLFTVPLGNVEETLSITDEDTSLIEGTEVIQLRGRTLPIFRLSSVFNIKSDVESEEDFVVVVSTGLQQVGLVVDELIGQEEVVIKPLVDYLQEKSGFSGATIIGDGRISLILDVYELANLTVNQQISKRKKLKNIRTAG